MLRCPDDEQVSQMKIENVPFCTIDWNTIAPTRHAGTTGEALWRTFDMGNIRVRMVEYSPGYLADHWCRYQGLPVPSTTRALRMTRS
jgi:hypothetical protein